MVVGWGGVRLLSQTRPIPRSPDGDKNGTKIGKSAPINFSFSVGIYNTNLPFATSVSLEIELYLFLRKYLQVY